MAKLFYTFEEVQEKLGRSSDDVKQLVSEGLLREFRDGNKKMFKVDEVDNLAERGLSSTRTSDIQLAPEDTSGGTGYQLAEEPPTKPAAEEELSLSDSGSGLGMPDTSGEIGLAPMDTSSDQISLEDTSMADSSEDTVITEHGVNVLEDSGEGVDEMGQTQMAPDLEDLDAMTLDSGSSGSGLLDLSREADDTSLGAELLDEIYPGQDEHQVETQVPDDRFQLPTATSTDVSMSSSEAMAQVVDYATLVQVEDPASNAYGAMLVLPLLAMLAMAMAATAAMQGAWPSLFEGMSDYVRSEERRVGKECSC